MLTQDVRPVKKLCDPVPGRPYHGDGWRVNNPVMAATRPLDISQQKLEELIRSRTTTQEERAALIKKIAVACNCGRELIYMWLNGTRRITDSKLQNLAEFFSVSPTYLKFGTPPLDAQVIDNVVHVVMAALIDKGVIETSVSADQISSLVAKICADYEKNGRTMDHDAIYSYIRIMAPAAELATTKAK